MSFGSSSSLSLCCSLASFFTVVVGMADDLSAGTPLRSLCMLFAPLPYHFSKSFLVFGCPTLCFLNFYFLLTRNALSAALSLFTADGSWAYVAWRNLAEHICHVGWLLPRVDCPWAVLAGFQIFMRGTQVTVSAFPERFRVMPLVEPFLLQSITDSRGRKVDNKYFMWLTP